MIRGLPDVPGGIRLPAQEDYLQLPLAVTQRSLFHDDDSDDNNINPEQNHQRSTGHEETPRVDNEDDGNSYIYTDYTTDEASEDE